jgi:serine/threonine-protein kinase HipA
MIKVWTDAAESGLMDRHGERGSSFVYLPGTPLARAVSITMPMRLESWSVPFGLPPIFEMNLPEGFLRERLRLAFAKATGAFDEFDLLAIVGRSQIGRIRYTGDKEKLQEEVPFQSVDEILERRRGGDLFRYLLERFATFSGISGVQPKFLLRDENAFSAMEHSGQRLTSSYRGATHIVKFWEPNELSATCRQRVFLSDCRPQVRTRRSALSPGRGRHGTGDRPIRSAHGRHLSGL